jgi:hypothetical protein
MPDNRPYSNSDFEKQLLCNKSQGSTSTRIAKSENIGTAKLFHKQFERRLNLQTKKAPDKGNFSKKIL